MEATGRTRVQMPPERRRPTALDGSQHLVLLGAQRMLRAHALSMSACDLADAQPSIAPGR
jgi:hypothetical protein